MTTVVYPGSFNPWTIGHQDILDRALQIFPHVLVVVAENPAKEMDSSFISWTLNALKDNTDNITIIKHQGLISEFGCPIIRGVRSGDWEYEQNLAVWNKELGVDTFFLCPDPSLSHINSSAVRLLHQKEQDISRYVDNELLLHRWLLRKKPKDTLYCGKICIGKSTLLKNKQVIDCDKTFWKHLYIDESAKDIKSKIKNYILDNRKQEYRQYISHLSNHVAWGDLLSPGHSYEVSALGMWWPYIPTKILSNFIITELSVSNDERDYFAKQRGLSESTIAAFDKFYQSPSFVDNEERITRLHECSI